MFTFYWKKEEQVLIFQIRCVIFVSVSVIFFFFFWFVGIFDSFLFLIIMSLHFHISYIHFIYSFHFFNQIWCFLYTFSLFRVSFINLKNGATPLFVAAGKGYEEIVQILMEKGEVNVNSQKNGFFFFFKSHLSAAISLLLSPFFLKQKLKSKKERESYYNLKKKLKPIQQNISFVDFFFLF